MKHFLRCALEQGVRHRALGVAFVVGTILNLVNQADALMEGAGIDFAKLLITYLVPYCSATYGAVAYRLHHERQAESLFAPRSN